MAFESHPVSALSSDQNGIDGLNMAARSTKIHLKGSTNSTTAILDVPVSDKRTSEVTGLVTTHGAETAEGMNVAEEIRADRRRPLRYVPNVGILLAVLDACCMALVQTALMDALRYYIGIASSFESLLMTAVCVAPQVLF